MLSKLTAWIQARFNVGFRAKLTAATVLLDACVRGADTIRRDLDVALDVINALRKATDGEKQALIEKYEAVLGSVRQSAVAAGVDGQSLVDGSGYALTLNEAGASGWQRELEHADLTPDAEGLDLPLVSDLGTGEKNCDEAQRRIAGAVKMVNKASSRLSDHQKALVKQLDQMDEDQHSDREAFQNDARESVSEIAQIVVIALVIALIFRSLIFQPFHIPSGSMKSTLLKGDYLFVSKYAYGYSNKSFPFGVKMFDGRIFGKMPQRGDVIVFKMTRDGKTDYIKRLIGLPGDKIQMQNGVLSINDEVVPKAFESEVLYTDGLTGEQFMVDQFTETLPNGVTHKTLDLTSLGRNDTTSIYRVPEGHYFFMGDNRDNSQDSRVIGGGVGFVPEENLVGRAEVIFLSVDGTARIWQIWRWPTAIRYSRIFKRIR